MTLKEKLREKQQRQQAILDAAMNDGSRDLAQEEKTEYDKLQREIEDLQRQIAQEEKGTDPQPPASSGVEKERRRTLDITNLCREFGKDPSVYIKEGICVEEVQRAILMGLKTDRNPVNTGISVGTDEEDKFRRSAAEGMVMRGGVEIEKPTQGAREFKGMSLKDLAIECMERSGEETKGLLRRSSDEIYGMLCRQFYNPTAAFPSILDTAINKAYVEGYNKAQVTFDIWTKKGTLKDFKSTKHEYLAGPAGDFYEVLENGEIKHDTPSDIKRPNRQLKTFGRQFTMSRQAFINDDIGFLSTIPARYAAAARRTQNKQVYQILVSNSKIHDGIALFDDKFHKNIIKTGTGPTQQVFQKMLLKLQIQKDQFGEQINIRPAYIIVPVGYSFDMFAIFNSPTIQTVDNTQAVNPLYNYRSMIKIIEDATLNGLVAEGAAIPWFLVGAKDDVDTIYVDYLNGDEIPKIRRMENPGTLGFVWDIYLDWGITATDFRGIIENPGMAITIE